jgi:hypothetical protein
MGRHHPVEYFAESILNPNAVIVTGPGYTDAEGLSIMPDYRDVMTVAEFVDLLAYLQSLKGGEAHDGEASHAGHDDHGVLLDQVIGDYHIRVLYHEAKADRHGAGGDGHHGHGTGTSKAKVKNHLMVFIVDKKSKEPVPYLPVLVEIVAPKQLARTLQLQPMMGSQGFHYGADARLPPHAARLTLSIGPTTMRVMPQAAGYYHTRQQVSLEWLPFSSGSHGVKDQSPPQHHESTKSGAKGP